MALLGVAHHLVDGCPSSPSAACALNIPYANSWTQTTIACHDYRNPFTRRNSTNSVTKFDFRSCWVPELAKQIVGPRRFHPRRWIQDQYVQNTSKLGTLRRFRCRFLTLKWHKHLRYSDQDCGRSPGFDLPTPTVGHDFVDKPTSRSLCTAPWMRPDLGTICSSTCFYIHMHCIN